MVAHSYNDAQTGTSVASEHELAQEPFYSNEDIGVLHAVVTAAQELIDNPRGRPKPLPVAALFKAYDEVLPQHGIDPDTDQHLSPLVFRVGGEVGDGTLIEKFQAVLGRMGIVLEFGDNTTASIKTSSSPAATDSPSTRPLTFVPGPQPEARTCPRSLGKHDLHDPKVNAPDDTNDLDAISEYQGQDGGVEAYSGPDPRDPLQAARRTLLSSAMNRWRNAATHNREGKAETSGAFGSINTGGTFAKGADEVQLQVREHQDNGAEGPVYRPSLLSTVNRWRSSISQDWTQGRMPGPQQPITLGTAAYADMHHPFMNVGDVLMRKAEPETNTARGGFPVQHMIIQRTTPHKISSAPSQHHNITQQRSPAVEEDAVAGDLERRLVLRAARARELYLASKFFNQWADRAARRLEREAVARRHMIRFRCFRGWSHVPNSRAPAVDHLKTITAAQKLQRAVAQNEEQLSLAAATIAQTHDLQLLQRALAKWRCQVTEEVARQTVAARSRQSAVMKWLSRARDDEAIAEAVLAHKQRVNERSALIRWHGQAETEYMRAGAARQVGQFHFTFGYLRDWWDRAETNQKAQTYRRLALMSKACHVFDMWNLQARTQAFLWRTEYLQATRAFGSWARMSQIFARKHSETTKVSESNARSRSWARMRLALTNHAQLEVIEGRARLFLGATRALDVFDSAMKQRKAQEKEAVKKFLKMRYQQVSQQRKKRNFFSALDRWRHSTHQSKQQASMAEISREWVGSHRQLVTIDKWIHEARTCQQKHYQAHHWHAKSFLNEWSEASAADEDRGLQAWSLWEAGKQRQYQKLWSISSLQQRGQAHTAAVLGQRNDRDKCNRVFQRWRHSCDKGKNVAFETLTPHSRGFGSAGGLRQSWRSSFGRTPQFGRLGDDFRQQSSIAQTPTRWTGQSSSMGSALAARPMPPVRESDEMTVSSSIDDEGIASPSDRQAGGHSQSVLPSTTPRGPVPAHLEQQFRPQTSHLPLDGQDQLTPFSKAPQIRFSATEPRKPQSSRSLEDARTIKSQSVTGAGSRPPPNRSVTADGSAPGSRHSDSPVLKSQSLGPQPLRKYVISRRSIFGASEASAEGSAATSSKPFASTLSLPRAGQTPRGGTQRRGR